MGFCVWPWDDAYRPVVGLFVNGRLVLHAGCSTERPRRMPVVSRALQARAWRRVRGERIGPEPIGPEGPDGALWFAMTPPPELRERLTACDPTVLVARLEDGEVVATEAGTPQVETLRQTLSVETLIACDAAPPVGALDGFPRLLEAPKEHGLDMLYLDYLRREADPAARSAYLGQLEAGEIDLFDLRRMIMESDEFRRRRIGPHDRLGGLLCTALWSEIGRYEALGHGVAPSEGRPS